MKKVTRSQLEDAIKDAAPITENLTGWKPEIANMKIHIMDKNDFFDLIYQNHGKQIANTVLKNAGRIIRSTVEKLSKAQIRKEMGPYKILYIGELDGVVVHDDTPSTFDVKGQMVHELTHRCQHIYEPKFFDTFSTAPEEHIKQMLSGKINIGMVKNLVKDRVGEEEFAYTALAEGHAIWAGSQHTGIPPKYLKHLKDKKRSRESAKALGYKVIEAHHRIGRTDAVKDLYKQDIIKLMQLEKAKFNP